MSIHTWLIMLSSPTTKELPSMCIYDLYIMMCIYHVYKWFVFTIFIYLVCVSTTVCTLWYVNNVVYRTMCIKLCVVITYNVYTLICLHNEHTTKRTQDDWTALLAPSTFRLDNFFHFLALHSCLLLPLITSLQFTNVVQTLWRNIAIFSKKYILPPRFWVPSTPSKLLSIYILIVSFGKDEKEAGIGPFLKKYFELSFKWFSLCILD